MTTPNIGSLDSGTYTAWINSSWLWNLCPKNSPKIRPGRARNLIPLEGLSLGICNLWDLIACVACRTRFPWIQHIQLVTPLVRSWKTQLPFYKAICIGGEISPHIFITIAKGGRNFWCFSPRSWVVAYMWFVNGCLSWNVILPHTSCKQSIQPSTGGMAGEVFFLTTWFGVSSGFNWRIISIVIDLNYIHILYFTYVYKLNTLHKSYFELDIPVLSLHFPPKKWCVFQFV